MILMKKKWLLALEQYVRNPLFVQYELCVTTLALSAAH